MKKLEIVLPRDFLKDMIQIIKETKGSGFSYYGLAGGGSTKDMLDKVKLEFVVKDGDERDIIRKAVQRIGKDIKTGGMVFISDVTNAVDLVSAKEGEAAIEEKREA
ncbi:MAG: P-II family nitrogen regulator [Nitrososphaerales archaeon]